MAAEQLELVKEAESIHYNFGGGISYHVNNPLAKLRMVAASCFFGEPSYYRDSSTGARPHSHGINAPITKQQMDYLIDVLSGIVVPNQYGTNESSALMEKIIDEALDYSVEQTLQVAVALRNEDLIRTTPQVIMVRAANHKNAKGTGLIRKYSSEIIKRADEPAVQLAYQLDKFGKTVPNALKRAWRDSLESFSEYQLAKYRMENRKVKTIDVVRFSHAHSEAIDKLVYGKLKLNTSSSWESLISREGSTKDTWEEVIDTIWIETE